MDQFSLAGSSEEGLYFLIDKKLRNKYNLFWSYFTEYQ